MGIRFAALIALPLHALVAGAQDIEWPKELETESGTVVVYQPQIEALDGNSLDAMAAVAVKTRANGGVPVFGAVWIQARLDTDRNTRTATIRDISITDVRFADATDEDKGKLAAFLEESVRGAAISISMDQVLADLDESGAGIAAQSLKHDPPKILHSTTPAILVSIDGEPAFRDIEGSMYERVINTPFLIVRGGRDHYLYAGGGAWYSSRAVEGPWMRARSVPAEIAGMVEQSDEPAEDIGDVEIIVATEPTELIVSAGPPPLSMTTPEPHRRHPWLATIGVDLVAFSLMHVVEFGGSFNYAALLVLPVLMAGVLTSRLLRLEYSPSGEFEDHPSQAFWYREQPVPEFTVKRS